MRRDLLLQLGSGFGSLAVAHLLSQDGLLAGPTVASAGGTAALNGGLHHRGKVKRVVQLFMNGGASPADTFDYKPQLEKLHGKTFDPGGNVKLESVTGSPGFKVLKSPFPFKQHGKSGRWVSSVFPHLAGCVDDLAFLMSMSSKTNVHGPASYMQNTGFVMPGFPSMGAWLSYGLGSLTRKLPTFVVIPDARGLPYNNQGDFSAGFLPVKHQGTIIRPNLPNPIADLFPPKSAPITAESERDGQALLAEANRATSGSGRAILAWTHGSLPTRWPPGCSSAHRGARPFARNRRDAQIVRPGPKTDRRLRPQLPDREEVAGTRSAVRASLERRRRPDGQLGQSWRHQDPTAADGPRHRSALRRAREGSQGPRAFEDTLIVWTTEFGRMPFSQGTAGRDHNAGTFVSWLAGAGVKPGVAYGESDEWAWKSRKPTWCYDLHATILHLMGIDHTRLTFRFNGANRRLTDVHGHVIHEVLA